MTETADVIIIGGGVQGASLAFHLASRGASVIELERTTIGAGATGRSAGLVRVYYDLLAEAKLSWASQAWFRDWHERVGGDCGFTQTGFLWMEPAANRDSVSANSASHRALGVNSSVLEADEIRRLYPGVHVEDEVGAWEPESGYADPSMTASSLAQAARRQGARFLSGAEVTAITQAGGRVTGVESTKGAFSAPVVVNAAGAWASRVGSFVGLDLPIQTWRHDTAYLGVPATLPRPVPVIIDITNGQYLRPEGGDMVLVGLDDDDMIGGDPDRDTSDINPAFADRAIEQVIRRLPAVIDGTFRFAHSGQDGLTPDQRAILGSAGSAAPDGFYLDCGHSGTGFKTSPMVGLAMAELILDGAAVSADISPFRYERFAEGELLRGENGEKHAWR